jgi:hypothetical protein
MWLQVWRIVFGIGTKAMFDGTLDRELARERILEELARKLRAGSEPAGAACARRLACSGKTARAFADGVRELAGSSHSAIAVR